MTPRPRVLVTRPASEIPEAALDILRETCDLVHPSDNGPIRPEVLKELIRGADGLFCLLTDKVDESVLEAADSLRVIGSMAVGYDHLDVEAIRKRNIPIGYTPDVLTDATAELTVAILLATARRLFEGSCALRSGTWGSWSPLWLCGPTLADSTVGIVGLGRIGMAILKRLEPFKVKKFLYTGRKPRPDVEGFVSFDELLVQSDFVIITCALTEETKNLFNAEAFQKMKSSAILVNTSRGGVIDQRALHSALSSGAIAAAGLDVMSPEPLPSDDPLTQLPNCVLVPHLGSATVQTRTEMAVTTARNILAGLADQPLPAQLL